MITLKELAERCGVSIATISNILNNKENVSVETKKRVLKIVKELDYKPNVLARSLRMQKTKTIGLIIEDITAFSTPLIVEGIMNYFEKNGYRVVFENLRMYSKFDYPHKNKDDFLKAVDSAFLQLSAYKVDGIIYIAAHCRNIDYLSQKKECPVVLCYSECTDENISEIIIDDENAAFEMINYFNEQGFRNIALIKADEQNVHGKKRMEGCIRSFKNNNIPLKKEFVIQGEWTRESGYKACSSLFKNGFNLVSGKKAIFCFNDLMAAGVYDYLLENKGNILDKIYVAGFDNREISEFLKPKLTTMEIPLLEIGIKSAQVLFELITEKKYNQKKIYIPCKLIKRESI